jgi:hypothetical protein
MFRRQAAIRHPGAARSMRPLIGVEILGIKERRRSFRISPLPLLVGVGKRLHSCLLERDVDSGRVGAAARFRQEIGTKIAPGHETTGKCQMSKPQRF